MKTSGRRSKIRKYFSIEHDDGNKQAATPPPAGDRREQAATPQSGETSEVLWEIGKGWIANEESRRCSSNSNVTCKAIVTNFGGLVLSCIEALWQ